MQFLVLFVAEQFTVKAWEPRGQQGRSTCNAETAGEYLYASTIICQVYLLRAHLKNPKYTKTVLTGPHYRGAYIVPPDSLDGRKRNYGPLPKKFHPGSTLRASSFGPLGLASSPRCRFRSDATGLQHKQHTVGQWVVDPSIWKAQRSLRHAAGVSELCWRGSRHGSASFWSAVVITAQLQWTFW